MKYVLTMTNDEIRASIRSFLEKNPNGGTLREITFSVGEDALLMGRLAPGMGNVQAVWLECYNEETHGIDTAIIAVAQQTNDWMYQRIPCDVVDRIRRVLEAMEEATSFPAHFGGEDIAPLIEAIRIKEK